MLWVEKQILWRFAAACLGMALPAMLFGRTVLFTLIILGATSGILATKGASLRATMHLLRGSRLVWLVLSLLAAFGVSVSMSIAPAVSLDKYIQLWLVAAVAVAVFIALREMPGRYAESMMKTLTITTAVCAVVALTDALTGYDRLGVLLHGDWFDTPYRLNYYAGALAVILPFVWARMLLKTREGEPFAKMVFVPLLVLTLVALIVAGGRIGWAGGIVALVVFVLFARCKHGLIFGMKQMLATLLTLALGFAGYVAAHGVAFFQLRMDLDAGARGFGGGRGDIWQAAWAHSFDNPVFGIGVNAFRYLPEQTDFHPHSAPLQLLLETGFIGLGLSVALGVFILRTFYGYAQHNVYGVAALSSFLAFCTVSLANTSIFNIWWLAFFVMLCLMGWRTGWASARKEF